MCSKGNRLHESSHEKAREKLSCPVGGTVSMFLGNGPNTVSESTVSKTELSELFGPHPVLGESLVSSFHPSI